MAVSAFRQIVIFSIIILNYTARADIVPGDPCTDDDDCDLSIFLECDTVAEICTCENSTESYFDQFDKQCHKYEGSDCDTEAVDLEMPCPPNGACSAANNTCICSEELGFVATETKKCAKPFDSACDDQFHCDVDAFVQCCGAPMKCACDDATSSFDFDTNQCLLKLNQPCKNSSDDGSQVQNCAKWAECVLVSGPTDWKCQCGAGMVENSEGECRAQIGESCVLSEKCDETNFLICTNSKCACKPGLSDNGEGLCRTKFGQPCDSSDLPCDESKFFECKEEATGDKKCACKASMVDLGQGECRATIGQSCASGEICDATNFLVCDAENDQKCICKSGLEENGQGRCRVKLGGACAADSPCDETNFLSCTNSNKCACQNGFSDNGQGLCRVNFGGDCGAALVCDESKFLVCQTGNGKCGCKPGMIDVGGGGQCKATIGQSCALGEPCDQTNFLVCSNDKKCECKAGLSDNGAGMCRANLGQTCNQTDLPCDENNFLTCDFNKKCACQSGLVANAVQKCTARLGQSCAAGVPCYEQNFMECGAKSEKCECKMGLSDNGNGLCRVPFGGKCSTLLPCDEDGFLNCDTQKGKCACAKSGAIFNFDWSMCVLDRGAVCESGKQPCDPTQSLSCDGKNCNCGNASVTIYDDFNKKCAIKTNAPCGGEWDPELDCVQNSQCDKDSDVCSCAKNFSPNPVGKCVLTIHSACQIDPDYCNHEGHQSCDPTDNRCSCRDPANMAYDSINDKCYLQIHRPCNTTTPDDPTCHGPLQVCDPISKKCVCDTLAGYVDDPDVDVCLKTFGSPCDLNDTNEGDCLFTTHTECVLGKCDCAQNYTKMDTGEVPRCAGNFDSLCDHDVECNNGAGLRCIVGKCGCFYQDSQTFDPDTESCLGHEGAICNLTWVEDEFEPTLLCLEGLQCVLVDEMEPNLGQCGSSGAGAIFVSGGGYFLTLILVTRLQMN